MPKLKFVIKPNAVVRPLRSVNLPDTSANPTNDFDNLPTEPPTIELIQKGQLYRAQIEGNQVYFDTGNEEWETARLPISEVQVLRSDMRPQTAWDLLKAAVNMLPDPMTSDQAEIEIPVQIEPAMRENPIVEGVKDPIFIIVRFQRLKTGDTAVWIPERLGEFIL